MPTEHIRATVENEEQLNAVLKSRSAELCFIDSGFFDAGRFKACVKKANENGVRLGLRLPQLWRDTAEAYFADNRDIIAEAGFDAYLFRNIEGLLSFREKGLLSNKGESRKPSGYMLDSSVYILNRASMLELTEMLKTADCQDMLLGVTLPQELNMHELRALTSEIGNYKPELVVYGRVPMMCSAQCIKKTVSGCDGRAGLFYLKDRTGAAMPCKNVCRFCCNTIYNSVPTMLYDLSDEIEGISPYSLRYEFTTECEAETLSILKGSPLKEAAFTRGHFRKSVE